MVKDLLHWNNRNELGVGANQAGPLWPPKSIHSVASLSAASPSQGCRQGRDKAWLAFLEAFPAAWIAVGEGRIDPVTGQEAVLAPWEVRRGACRGVDWAMGRWG